MSENNDAMKEVLIAAKRNAENPSHYSDGNGPSYGMVGAFLRHYAKDRKIQIAANEHTVSFAFTRGTRIGTTIVVAANAFAYMIAEIFIGIKTVTHGQLKAVLTGLRERTQTLTPVDPFSGVGYRGNYDF